MVMIDYHDFLCLLPSFKVLSNRIGISMYIYMYMLIIVCLDIQFLILLKILEMLHLFVVSTLHNSLERTSPECFESVVAERESIYYIVIHLEICIYIYIIYIYNCMHV
jgi:hypothetical protein